MGQRNRDRKAELYKEGVKVVDDKQTLLLESLQVGANMRKSERLTRTEIGEWKMQNMTTSPQPKEKFMTSAMDRKRYMRPSVMTT
jgi:hypothetical protein